MHSLLPSAMNYLLMLVCVLVVLLHAEIVIVRIFGV